MAFPIAFPHDPKTRRTWAGLTGPRGVGTENGRRAAAKQAAAGFGTGGEGRTRWKKHCLVDLVWDSDG